MNIVMILPRSFKIVPTLFLCTIITGESFAAYPQSSLLNQERKQQRIQDSTRRTGEQLDALVDEFERNGLMGADLDVLKAIRRVLGGLSSKQMAEIVAMLGGARINPNAPGSGAKVLGAYAGQKGVIVQLRRVLLEYQTQVALFELARHVRELGNRQTTNLHEGIALASSAFDATRPKNSEQISLQLQSTEQESLSAEAGIINDKLKSIAELTAGSPDQRPKKAVAFANEAALIETLSKAAQEITNKRIMSAVSLEKTSRDNLWKLAKILEPEKDKLEKMVEALERLDDIIDEETEIAKSTDNLGKEEKRNREELVFPQHIKNQIQQFERAIERTEKQVEQTRQQVATQVQNAEKRVADAEKRVVDAEKAVENAEKGVEDAKAQNNPAAIQAQQRNVDQQKRQVDQQKRQVDQQQKAGRSTKAAGREEN